MRSRTLFRPLALVLLLPWIATAADIPRPEHPRPNQVRPHWLNLNGDWQFRFDPGDAGKAQNWQTPGAQGFDRTINVPFGWEAPLSGIADTSKDNRIGWYRRAFRVPETFPNGHRVWLRFEAVDWEADVWVNGQLVAQHEGGYSPFEADVTAALKPGEDNTLVVRAFDPTDPELPTGKQVGWYTTTSGIWQTAWLEARPATYIDHFTIKTLSLNPAKVGLEVRAKGDAKTLRVSSPDPSIAATELKAQGAPNAQGFTVFEGEFNVANPKLWSPESPHLYDLTLSLDGADTVQTYTGLRTIERAALPGEPFERIILNGKPIYLRGALDQSFNPGGVYTAPSDDFLKADIELAKSLNLNFLRIHIKPEEPRRLYWADRLGMLIMQDMPNTWKQTPRARKAWEATMREVIARDINHPSIFSWVAFNETWGLGVPFLAYKTDPDTQAWVSRMVDALRSLDPTRLVEDNSPCHYDQISNTDINSWHFYIDDHEEARKHIEDVVAQTFPGSTFNMADGQKMNSAPLINSEYGSVSAGGGDRDVSWGFRDLTTQLRRHAKIQGYVYTELSDIEWEHNGFVDYDRTSKDFGYDVWVPGMTPAQLQGEDFVGYDAPPAIVGKPGETVKIPVFVSHFSDREKAPKLVTWVHGFDADGQPVTVQEPKTQPVTWKAYDVTGQGEVEVTLPDGPFVGALGLALVDADAPEPIHVTKTGFNVPYPIAANFVNLVTKPDAPADRVERKGDQTALVRFSPEEFSRSKFSDGSDTISGKAYGRGHGTMTYKLQLPKAIAEAGPNRITLRAEMAAKAGRDQVDWAERVNRQDYPQTDSRRAPTRVRVSINGQPAEADVELMDDPADARGVLSHLNRAEHGSCGYPTDVTITLSDAARAELADGKPLVLELTVPERTPESNGVAVYGESAGAYPFDPMLLIETAKPLPADLGVDASKSLAVDVAASRRITLLPAGDTKRGKSAVWSFTTDDPGPGWNRPKFDASSWSTGSAGFGSSGTPALQKRTPWNTPNIWLRTEVDVPALGPDDHLTLHLFHDEDATIFVNGERLARQRGFVSAYEDLKLTPETQALFRPGRNVIAVHCRQSTGGQGIDLGLILDRNEP